MSHATDRLIYPLERPLGIAAPIQCPAHRNGEARRSDDRIMEEMLRWLREQLPCVAGRREFNRKRYTIEIVDGAADVLTVFHGFVSAARAHASTACLFVFNNPAVYAGCGDARSAFRYLAGQMAPLGHCPAHELANGGALSSTLRIACPVTGVETDFDDFECIAFCPQSSDLSDPLYDPLMAAPYTCVNMSSDVFAFSYFVMESAITKFGKAPHQIRDIAILAPFFSHCVERWHKIACATIGNFAAITDTARCPVHITPSGDHWIAAHRDPAFAETEKIPHRHELPIIYANRICDAWIEHFAEGRFYRAAGLAREGMLQ